MIDPRGRRRLIAVLASAALAAAACAPGSGAGEAAAPTAGAQVQAITLTARDINYSTSDVTLRAGVPVRLTLVNEGAIEHDLTIPGLAAGDAAVQSQHDDGMGMGHSMGALAPGTVHISVLAGQRQTVEFTPKAGTYELYCSVPGHREAGMHGTVRVA